MLYLFTPITQSIVATYGSTGLLGLMILEVYGLRLPALLHRKYTPWSGRIGTGVSSLLQRAAFRDVQ